MDAFEIEDVFGRRERSGGAYLEFIRVPGMSVGVYHLPAGSSDPQSPHGEDEVYHVIQGRASIRVGDEDRAVRAGTVVFVAARVPHAFHSIEEDLDVLVVFAPAEGTTGPRTGARRRGPRLRGGRRPARSRAGSRPRPRA